MAYIHSMCQREFDSQELLDNHVAAPLEDPVCRVNEGKLLTKGFNY
jgi:hypothetical protein